MNIKVKKTVLMTVSFLFCVESHAQNCSSCREFVRTFYTMLFENHNISEDSLLHMGILSSEWPDIKRHREQLTRGLNLEELEDIINHSKTCYDGDWIDSLVLLCFPNDDFIYFQLSDNPPALNRIWVRDGQGVFTDISGLKRPAIINDSDGYVNIRKEPNAKSQVVKRIKDNELLFFTPIPKTDWYPVYFKKDGLCIGYIHKSRIKTFEDFPKWLQEKVRKMGDGY